MDAEQRSKEKSWEIVQIKAFTGWINQHLAKEDLQIHDIIKDLSDGVLFIAFLQIVHGSPVPFKYDPKPAARIHKINNLSPALKHLKENMNVQHSVSAENFVDEDKKLILGCLWTMFRKYNIQTIKTEDKSSEEGLLLWVKKQTETYNHINIESYKYSFRDGMAFLALVDKLVGNPEIVNYSRFSPDDKERNLQAAFEFAEAQLGIPKLLEPHEVATGHVDERAIVLVLSMFYQAYQQMEKARAAEEEKRKIASRMMELEEDLSERERESRILQERNANLNEELERLRNQLREQEDKLATKVQPEDVWKTYLEESHSSKSPIITIPFHVDETVNKKTYTVYHIKVEMMDKIWIVKRRYSEFVALHEKLCKQYKRAAASLHLPPKKYLGNMDESFVEERKSQLKVFLNEICSDEEFAGATAFADFISKDSIVSLIDEKVFKRQQKEKYEREQERLKMLEQMKQEKARLEQD